MDAGHLTVWDYPLWLVWQETEFVVNRENERLANEAMVIQGAAASIVSPKEGGGFFRKLVQSLLGK